MTIYLLQTSFVLLLFALLLVCCTSYLPAECAHSSDEDSCPSDQDGFFKNKEIKKALTTNGDDDDEKKINVKKVFLVASDQSMVALAETNYEKETEKNKLFFVKQFLKTKNGKWCKDAAESKLVKWKINEEGGTQLNTFSEKGTSAVVVKENNLYFFVVNGTPSEDASGADDDSTINLNFPIFVSEVTLSGENILNEEISFEKKKLVPLSGTLKDMQELKKEELSITSLTESYAFLTENEEKIMLVVKSELTKDSSSGKNVAALYCMEKTNKNLELMYVSILDNCIPHFILWNQKIFMIPTGCVDCGTNKVNQSADMKIWTKSNSFFSSLLDTLCGGKAFTTTNIEGNRVLLFLKEDKEGDNYKLHLWITDGSRLHNVGAVDGTTKCSFNGFLLHKDKKLFLLYNNGKESLVGGGDNNFVVVNLGEKINDIKIQLQNWKTVGKTASNVCGYKKDCSNKMPTDGLVSFLHNKGNSNKWEDEYNYGTAIVSGEGKFNSNGFTLNTPGAEVKWEVNSNNKDKPFYNFMKYGFTIVLTVDISKIPESDNHSFFFGLVVNENIGEENEKRFGLFYGKEGKWKLIKNTEEVVDENKKLESEGKYQVALCFTGDSKLSAYVNWKPLDNPKAVTIVEHESIKENKGFYFAATIGKDASKTASEFHVSVADFLLYNRPLSDEEIKQLELNFVTTEKDQSTLFSSPAKIPSSSGVFSDSTISETESSNNGDKGTVNPITSTNEKQEVTSTSLSSRESAVSASDGFVVFYGLLSVWAFVFCLFDSE